MRILVVEDEPKVASFIRRALEEESYAVDVCADGQKGLDWAQSVDYDLIILDLMLPGIPGLELLKQLRRNGVKIPVVILTARSEVDQRVKGLDAGADDYLSKPFSSTELLLRIRNRRQPLEREDHRGVDHEQSLCVRLPNRHGVTRGAARRS